MSFQLVKGTPTPRCKVDEFYDVTEKKCGEYCFSSFLGDLISFFLRFSEIGLKRVAFNYHIPVSRRENLSIKVLNQTEFFFDLGLDYLSL